MLVDFDAIGSTGDGFFTGKSIIMDNDKKWWFEVKMPLWICFLKAFRISLHKMLINYSSQLFGLSFWRRPYTAEDPIVSKWCNAQFLFPWRNKLGLREGAFSIFIHTKMKILSSFTPIHVVPTLYDFCSSVEHKIIYFEKTSERLSKLNIYYLKLLMQFQ